MTKITRGLFYEWFLLSHDLRSSIPWSILHRPLYPRKWGDLLWFPHPLLHNPPTLRTITKPKITSRLTILLQAPPCLLLLRLHVPRCAHVNSPAYTPRKAFCFYCACCTTMKCPTLHNPYCPNYIPQKRRKKEKAEKSHRTMQCTFCVECQRMMPPLLG